MGRSLTSGEALVKRRHAGPERPAGRIDSRLGGRNLQKIGHLAADPGQLALGEIAAVLLHPGQRLIPVDGAGKMRRQGLDADRPHGRQRRIEIECEELPHLAEAAGGDHAGGAPVDPVIEAGAVGNDGEAQEARTEENPRGRMTGMMHRERRE